MNMILLSKKAFADFNCYLFKQNILFLIVTQLCIQNSEELFYQ